MGRTKAAAFFDLDKTVIATSSFTALTGEFLARGVTTRRALLRTAYAQAAFLLGSADYDKTERLRVLLADLVEGWDAGQVRQIARETLEKAISPKVYQEALSLIASHKAAGRDVVVVSASGIEIVEPIAEALGADHALGTRMAIEDGKYTGEIEFYCHAENKPAAMAALADKNGYDLARSYAYSDSVTDVPMLKAVGYPVVVNPSRALRAIADTEGWEALSFTHTTSLGPHVSRGVLAGTAALTIGLGAFALGWRLGGARRAAQLTAQLTARPRSARRPPPR